MRFTHNDTTYIITDCLNNGQCDRGYRITERGTIIEDTAAVVRAYHAYFLDKYGLENLATDKMIRLERQWDAEVAEQIMVARELDETHDDFLAGTGRR